MPLALAAFFSRVRSWRPPIDFYTSGYIIARRVRRREEKVCGSAERGAKSTLARFFFFFFLLKRGLLKWTELSPLDVYTRSSLMQRQLLRAEREKAIVSSRCVSHAGLRPIIRFLAMALAL